MDRNPDHDKLVKVAGGEVKPGSGDARAARLKAALKANMARRKAQARLRSAGRSDDQENEKG